MKKEIKEALLLQIEGFKKEIEGQIFLAEGNEKKIDHLLDMLVILNEYLEKIKNEPEH